MSSQLALDLDHDAIRLLSHQTDGWIVEGVAELDSPDLTQKIAGLRQRAEDLCGPDPAVLLVLPRSQVLYLSFDGLENPDSDIADRLDGLTPYRTSEIIWDQATVNGRTDVAAVALETMDEACAFANASRFRVLGVTSEPPEGEFPRMPVFRGLLAEEPQSPLLLEPAGPPERAAVPILGQHEGEQAPRRMPLAAVAAAATARATRTMAALPDRAREFVSLIPKPLLAAMAFGGAVIVGAALWPERDPDPFTKRNVDRSFTEFPAALMQGLAPLYAEDASTPLSDLEPVTVLRNPPVIVVPVVIGANRVEADYSADVAVEEAFGRIAAVPALYGETLLPTPDAEPVAVLAQPEFPRAEAPGISRVMRATAPAPLAPSPAETPEPTVSAIATPQIPRLPGSLPAAAGIPAPPDAAAPADPPSILADAPVVTAAPSGRPAPAPPSDPPDSQPEPPSEFASLPPTSDLIAPLPDVAIALLPPRAGERFEVGPDGFVVATPEGAATPGGALAIAGAPPLIAPPRPGTTGDNEAATGSDVVVEPAETAPVAAIAVTRTNPNPELVAFLPRPRPATAVSEPSELAAPAVQVSDEMIAEALATPEEAEPVLTVSLVPRPRPDRPAAPAAQTATATRAAPAAPRIPSRASVAREATIEGAIALNRLNLIGVYGSANDRRALVRLPTGRFVKLKVGDRLDGGQVAQIGPDRLLYQKGNRTLALEMPNT